MTCTQTELAAAVVKRLGIIISITVAVTIRLIIMDYKERRIREQS